MKRIFALLFVAFILNGCDDGDLISQDIDFADVNMARCGTPNSDILYKLNDRDALILQVPNLDTELPLVPTPEGQPDSLAINGTTIRLVYRVYGGEPEINNICASIQPPTPAIIEEWNAISGTIKFTTTTRKEPNSATGFAGGEKITALRHAIVIRNVTWETPNNQIVDETVEFGNYDQAFNAPNIAGFSADTFICPNNLIYRRTANTTFTINIDPALLSTDVLNTPKVGLISDTSNQVTFKRFAIGSVDFLNTDTGYDFCPDYAEQIQEPNIETWSGQNGVAGVSGIVEVTTTQVGLGFIHTIRLKNVTLARTDGAFSFKIADDFLYGELSVAN